MSVSELMLCCQPQRPYCSKCDKRTAEDDIETSLTTLACCFADNCGWGCELGGGGGADRCCPQGEEEEEADDCQGAQVVRPVGSGNG